MADQHPSRADSKFIATENELWIPPLSFEDQEKINRFRKKRRKERNEWVGFTGRTLWDWLNLLGVLAIPFVVTVLGLYFTQQITQQQAQLSIAANHQQHATDLQIAEDQQRETTLENYLNNMSDLLLSHNLRKSKPGDEVSEVARERTLTTLRKLDANRNKIVLQFLQDARLIAVKNAVIDLSYANLSGDDLREANLSGVELYGADLTLAHLDRTNLGEADLSGADLSGADLSEAILAHANLSGAFADLAKTNLSGAFLIDADLSHARLRGDDLSRADLSGAILSGAHLHGDDLSGADLSFTDLSGADLSRASLIDAELIGADLDEANLTSAKVTQEQLAKASSLKGTIMPDGSKHP